jgi:hypothetical protein
MAEVVMRQQMFAVIPSLVAQLRMIRYCARLERVAADGRRRSESEGDIHYAICSDHRHSNIMSRSTGFGRRFNKPME